MFGRAWSTVEEVLGTIHGVMGGEGRSCSGWGCGDECEGGIRGGWGGQGDARMSSSYSPEPTRYMTKSVTGVKTTHASLPSRCRLRGAERPSKQARNRLSVSAGPGKEGKKTGRGNETQARPDAPVSIYKLGVLGCVLSNCRARVVKRRAQLPLIGIGEAVIKPLQDYLAAPFRH